MLTLALAIGLTILAVIGVAILALLAALYFGGDTTEIQRLTVADITARIDGEDAQ